MTYRYLFEVIIAGNNCEKKNREVCATKKWTSAIFTKLELFMQVLLYFTSIEILSDRKLD